MSLVINHNLMASRAARNLSMSFSALGKSVSRLSSGLRITSAADDAAGLAVRELMRGDIASLNQGIRNANDAISAIQTADGALAVIDEKLIRMKELAEQAATGTYSSAQRVIIDSEYQAMAEEITRIANSTDFNGIYLLNGNLSGATHDGSGLTSTGKLKIHFGTANDSAEDYYYIQIGSATANALGLVTSGSGLDRGVIDQFASTHNLTYSLSSALNLYPSQPSNWATEFDQSQTALEYTDGGNQRWVFAVDNNGLTRYFTYQTGTNEILGQGTASVPTISTQQLAQQALETIKNAIISKDTIRANLGALQNRLENTITNLEIQAENLQAAESRISDVDVSLEMTEFVRRQILSQSAVAMLSQANSLPRMALQLLS